MVDKLEELFRIQNEFQKLTLRNEILDSRKKVELTKDYKTYIIYELDEFLGLLPFKSYRTYDWENLKLDSSKMLGELVDAFKFHLNIVDLWGFRPNQFYDEFLRKSKIVEERYRREFGIK